MTEKIKCDGCGIIREWNGMECLTICNCMKERQIVEDIDDRKNGQVNTFVKRQKFYIITSGRDWADASCVHLMLICNKTGDELKELYDKAGGFQGTKSFYPKWLTDNGYARDLEDDEYEETHEW